MDRRALITTAGALALTGCATPTSNQNNGSGFNSNQSAPDKAATYTRDELVPAVSDFFGVTVESAGAVIEKVFGDNGRPTGYIAGEEASAAVTVGARYGNGLLYMKSETKPLQVFWQGPSVGFDLGGDVKTLVRHNGGI